MDGASDLPEVLTDRTAFLMQLALARAQAMGEEALAELGLSGREYGALAVLAHLQPCPQIRAGRALGVDRTTILATVRGLLRRRLIRRDPDPADRRAYLISLTAPGEEVRARAAEVLADCEDRFLAVLPPADRARLAAALRVLVDRPRDPGGDPAQLGPGPAGERARVRGAGTGTAGAQVSGSDRPMRARYQG